MSWNMSPELPLGGAEPPACPVSPRRLAIPDCAPPYDDEAGHGGSVAGACQPAGPGRGDRLAGQHGPPRPAVRRPGAAPSGRPPGSGSWPGQFAQALAETLAGTRPARQLTPWTTEQTRLRIAELGRLLATAQRPRVRRIMTSVPRPGVVEVTAVVGFGPRVRVLALRLEQADQVRGRWQCTAIESA